MPDCSDYYSRMAVPSKVQEFQCCIGDIGLVDIHGFGPTFTWSNKRVDGFLARKLDRAMANSLWLDILPNYEVNFLS